MDAASSAPNPLIFLASGLCFLALLIAWLALFLFSRYRDDQ